MLIDSRTAKAVGGTGVAFDWRAARTSFLLNAPHLRLILAGGLRPENVADAIYTLQPWGVDVASGVEAAPGKKDPTRVKAFVSAVEKPLRRLMNKDPPKRSCLPGVILKFRSSHEHRNITHAISQVPGRFGAYGGRYVPETLMAALEELDAAYAEAQADPAFHLELDSLLKDYAGRPTPLYFASRLTEELGGAKIS